MASQSNGAAGIKSPPRPEQPTLSADPTLDTLIHAIAASRGWSIDKAIALIWNGDHAQEASR